MGFIIVLLLGLVSTVSPLELGQSYTLCKSLSWVKVSNNPIQWFRNGTQEMHPGETCITQGGRAVRCLMFVGDSVLVEYDALERITGTGCPTGAQFWVDTTKLADAVCDSDEILTRYESYIAGEIGESDNEPEGYGGSPIGTYIREIRDVFDGNGHSVEWFVVIVGTILVAFATLIIFGVFVSLLHNHR